MPYKRDMIEDCAPVQCMTAILNFGPISDLNRLLVYC